MKKAILRIHSALPMPHAAAVDSISIISPHTRPLHRHNALDVSPKRSPHLLLPGFAEGRLPHESLHFSLDLVPNPFLRRGQNELCTKYGELPNRRWIESRLKPPAYSH